MNYIRQAIGLLTLLSFTGCYGQAKYYKPDGIVDKTDQLLKSKAGWTPLGDKERVDGYTRMGTSVFGGEIDCNIQPLKGIDIETFQVYPGTNYAKDKESVYYPIEVKCVDYENCGVCYYDKVIVERADPATFKYLGSDYATDGKFAYFRGLLIKEADGATFEVVNCPKPLFFAKDKNSVYMHNKVFKDADPSTFRYSEEDSINNTSGLDERYIIMDENDKWEYTPPDQIKKVE